MTKDECLKVDLQRFRRACCLALASSSEAGPLQEAAKKEVINQMPLLLKELNRSRKMEKLRESERERMVHGAIDVGPYKIPVMIPQEEELEQGEALLFGRLTLLDFISDDQCNIIINEIEVEDIEKAKALEDKIVGIRIKEYRKDNPLNIKWSDFDD